MYYQCELKSVRAFVQRLAVDFVAKGYWFYCEGLVSERWRERPEVVDQAIIRKYGIEMDAWHRWQQKQQGIAAIGYMRFAPTGYYLILATKGERGLLQEEHGDEIHDFRRKRLEFEGYSIGFCRGSDGKRHASVMIAPWAYRAIKAHFVDLATKRSVESLAKALRALPFEHYALVVQQLQRVVKCVNRARKTAGLEPVPWERVAKFRKQIKPFAEAA